MVVVLCHTPDRVLTVFKAIKNPEGVHCTDPLIYASHLCNLLIVVNSSANFVIYCIFRQRFRRILCRLLCHPVVGDRWQRDSTTRLSEQTSLRSTGRRSTPHEVDRGHGRMNNGRAASDSAPTTKRSYSAADDDNRKPMSDANKEDEAIVTFHVGPG